MSNSRAGGSSGVDGCAGGGAGDGGNFCLPDGKGLGFKVSSLQSPESTTPWKWLCVPETLWPKSDQIPE